MNEILKAISDALERKGISEAAASRMAAGHASVIKSFRTSKSTQRAHPIENLKKVADVLDLEFYFGPPRGSPTGGGFAEAALARIQPAIDGSPEALSQGYVPIPYHEEAHTKRGFAPIAFARSWLEEQGYSPSALACIGVPEWVDPVPGIQRGQIALINRNDKTDLDGRTFAFFPTPMAGVEFGRLLLVGSSSIIIVKGEDAKMQMVGVQTGIRVIGAVVWSGGSNHNASAAR